MPRHPASSDREVQPHTTPARRVTAETNERLPSVQLGPRHHSLPVPLSAKDTSVMNDMRSPWERKKSRDSPGLVDLFVPHISWNELVLLETLRSGNSATVQLALWNDVKVAYKEWHKLTNDESIVLVKEEARILASLLHPCVRSLYGMVMNGPSPGLVLEYLPHNSLRSQLQLMRGTEIDTTRFKAAVALKAARGVKFIHQRNVFGLDLRCENLLCNFSDLENPIVKVSDAALCLEKDVNSVCNNIHGTLPWMAPEFFPDISQFDSFTSVSIKDKVDEKVDVYSFGVVLWEIWGMGAKPHEHLTASQLVDGISTGTLRLVSPWGCDPFWQTLMEQCLRRNPYWRPNFKSIIEKLEGLYQTLSP